MNFSIGFKFPPDCLFYFYLFQTGKNDKSFWGILGLLQRFVLIFSKETLSILSSNSLAVSCLYGDSNEFIVLNWYTVMIFSYTGCNSWEFWLGCCFWCSDSVCLDSELWFNFLLAYVKLISFNLAGMNWSLYWSVLSFRAIKGRKWENGRKNRKLLRFTKGISTEKIVLFSWDYQLLCITEYQEWSDKYNSSSSL